MPADEEAGATLRRLGWHQGALLPVNPGSRLAQLLEEGVTHAVVVSQDCDIVANAVIEPCVDLLPASVTTYFEGDLLYGKNPRRLCLELESGQFAIVDIRHRQTVEKVSVADIVPLPTPVVATHRRILAKWLGKRYTRPAFPDAFNGRLETQKKKLAQLSKREDGKLVTGIYMMLNIENELSSSESYEVTIWFACRTEVADDLKERVEAYATDFVAAMRACQGIEIIEHEVRAEFDISLEDLRSMKRFDFDFRSDAPKPGGETVTANQE